MNEQQSETALITGNTFPVKDQLKGMGGKWSKGDKGWLVPKANEAAARKLVAEAPVQPYSASTPRPSRCRECGCAPSRYNKIYRNGLCRDCFVANKEEADMGY